MMMACTWVKSHPPEHGNRPGTASLKETDDSPPPEAMIEIAPWLCVGSHEFSHSHGNFEWFDLM